ncbi:SatD family protein [Vaginisenegalia massiliensis]|uniref:SatD family protein n=1 Tax=Vaginisenegalia massiliensis TaxID=2058294 RepID=UPI000F541105|nr:SatD family protein [Vaginisenegalia massiliensis]
MTQPINQYLVVMADIKDSRQLADRDGVQNHLIQLIKELNKNYDKACISPLTLVMGDSFQGLFQLNLKLDEFLFDLILGLYPVKLRIGLGIGSLSTQISPDDSHLNDGPAYHNAKAMIEQLEQSENQNGRYQTNLALKSDQAKRDELVNAIFATAYPIQESWTDRQVEIMKCFRANDENQRKTAEAMNLLQPAISKSLKASHYYEIQYAFKVLAQNFKEEGR